MIEIEPKSFGTYFERIAILFWSPFEGSVAFRGGTCRFPRSTDSGHSDILIVNRIRPIVQSLVMHHTYIHTYMQIYDSPETTIFVFGYAEDT
jgi:hypothetical protein